MADALHRNTQKQNRGKGVGYTTELERFKELNKLTDWLIKYAPAYDWRVERFDRVVTPESPLTDFRTGDTVNDIGQHMVIVYSNDKHIFDAICHYGSYGYHIGRLEIMGSIVFEDDHNNVVGYLTADDVIERIIQVYG